MSDETKQFDWTEVKPILDGVNWLAGFRDSEIKGVKEERRRLLEQSLPRLIRK